MAKKMVNGVLMDLTPEEEQERIAREEQAVIERQTDIDAEDARLAKIESGKQKLRDLGLDNSEIKELTKG